MALGQEHKGAKAAPSPPSPTIIPLPPVDLANTVRQHRRVWARDCPASQDAGEPEGCYLCRGVHPTRTGPNVYTVEPKPQSPSEEWLYQADQYEQMWYDARRLIRGFAKYHTAGAPLGCWLCRKWCRTADCGVGADMPPFPCAPTCGRADALQFITLCTAYHAAHEPCGCFIGGNDHGTAECEQDAAAVHLSTKALHFMKGFAASHSDGEPTGCELCQGAHGTADCEQITASAPGGDDLAPPQLPTAPPPSKSMGVDPPTRRFDHPLRKNPWTK